MLIFFYFNEIVLQKSKFLVQCFPSKSFFVQKYTHSTFYMPTYLESEKKLREASNPHARICQHPSALQLIVENI